MQLKSPNKSWPKRMRSLYFGCFQSDCKSGQFIVPNSMFSNSDILDCLESEINSAQAMARLVRNFFDKKNGSILIVGAGSGRLGTQIREIFPTVDLVEIDKNRFVVQRLESKYKDDLMRKSYCIDVCCMPFADNSFDLVICYSVFRYIDDLNVATNELIRVVKNNGKVLIAEAKDFSTVKNVEKILSVKNISLEKKTIPSVRLPHLTFYYYLLTQYKKNEAIAEIVNMEKDVNMGYFQAIFKLAGSSLGSIYTLILKKNT